MHMHKNYASGAIGKVTRKSFEVDEEILNYF